MACKEFIGWRKAQDHDEDFDNEPSIARFNPDDSAMHRGVPKDIRFAYNHHEGISHVRYFAGPYRLLKDTSSVVIHIDGACRENGTHAARGAWGVYFGPQSPYNRYGLLPASEPQTSSYAELCALNEALDIVRYELPPFLQRVFIVSDSSHLLQTFMEYIFDWMDNVGRNFQERKVAHWTTLFDMSETIDDLIWPGGRNLKFKFWHVPTEMNQRANALAYRALNRSLVRPAYEAILPSHPGLYQARRTTLITGGIGGISDAILRNFDIASANKVIITSRSEGKLQGASKDLAKEVKAINANSNTKYEGRACQVAGSSSIYSLFDGLSQERTYGDVLVLSAVLMVHGKITDQTWKCIWEQFMFNVRSTHQFRDMFEKQPRIGDGPRYIINASSSAIHNCTAGADSGSYKNTAALSLQKIADETDPSKKKIINFHPGSILVIRVQEYGLTADSANRDHVTITEDLLGSFAV
ncbi:peroxisomal short-chain alcohol dehydrogenase [Fusarium beomiforme]|uniref:Peroxisomal short-chain alcohol dehydrogenase n=1 Tax=Fusarium beomiforme TaxID=44412 RepID=A0A9P5A5B5_9HYPO|nr:peroxisomal short-chain alcohol dehydrogenase [Fusarium beomiforme]